MKLFKTFSAILGLAALCVNVHGQQAGAYQTGALDGSTNCTLAATSTNYFSGTDFMAVNNHGVAISEYDHVGFQMSVAASNTCSGTVTVRLAQSYDFGATWESRPSFTIVSPPLNGVTPISFATDCFSPAATHIRLYSWENTNSVGLTGAYAKIGLKTPKRGANVNVSP